MAKETIMTLRPIGTEFVVESPPNLYSTNSEFTLLTYRVKAHVEISRFRCGLHRPETTWGEEIECIKIEAVPYKLLVDGSGISYERI